MVDSTSADRPVFNTPNELFFEKYGGEIEGCSTFLMRHAVSEMNEAVRALKSSQEYSNGLVPETEQYRAVIFDEAKKDAKLSVNGLN